MTTEQNKNSTWQRNKIKSKIAHDNGTRVWTCLFGSLSPEKYKVRKKNME